MTFESATPPTERRFDPRVGWIGCGFCSALFQFPVYDEEGNFYQSEIGGANYQAHSSQCTEENPYLTDLNAYYPSGANDPEPKCYDTNSCFY